MSEAKEKKNWYEWIKRAISAVVGAVITFAVTIGLVGGGEAEVAKETVDGLLDKSDQAYVQIEQVSKTVAEVKKMLDDKQYIEAIKKLDDIGKEAKETITTVLEIKSQVKTIVDSLKQKIEEAKEAKEAAKEAAKEEAPAEK